MASTNPLTQKALVVTAIGQPVTQIERPIFEPGLHEVQVKVKIAGLNPHDQKARDRGLFIAEHLPAILAADVVGTVTKVGEGVTDVALGDRVVFQSDFNPNWKQSGLQEYALANANYLAKIPDSISDQEAATLPTNVVAGLIALFAVLKIPAPWSPEAKSFPYADTTILIVGGGSSCGKFGVQLAKIANIGRIVVVGGNVSELKGYGATDVIDRHGGFDTVLGRIKDVVGDDLIYAYDVVNPPEGQLLGLNALSSHKRGSLARLVPLGPVDESRIVGKTAGYDVLNVLGLSSMHPELAAPFWARLPNYLETGRIKTLEYVVKHAPGLDAGPVNEVLDSYRDGKPTTKTHITL